MVDTKVDKKLYRILWYLVVVLCILVFTTHLFFKLAVGRWECVEYKEICNDCEFKGEYPIKIIYNSTVTIDVRLNWSTVSPNQCICTNIENKCIKEVWTRNLE